MAQEAQQRFHELDAIRNGYQQIMDAYQDLYQQLTEFRQPLQVHSHLEMPRILIQLDHIQRT